MSRRKVSWTALGPDSGLLVRDLGAQGVAIETTPALQSAVDRHERVLAFMDGACCGDRTQLSAGALLLLMLPANEHLLTLDALRAATSASAEAYSHAGTVWLEWSYPERCVDRREVTPQTVRAAKANGGFVVGPAEWREAARALRQLQPEKKQSGSVMEGFLADARAWWYGKELRPLFLHAVALRQFQLLPRAALARVVSGKPQAPEHGSRQALPDDIAARLTTQRHTGGTSAYQELIVYVGYVARDKSAKDHGRELIVDRINMLLPLAASESREEVIVLGGIRFALTTGGVRGIFWAPVTIYEYLRVSLSRLIKKLVARGLSDPSGEKWHQDYSEEIESVPESQRGKFSAFIQVFHRFLVMAGAEPLPRPLPGSTQVIPPDAATVTLNELHRAVAYVQRVAPTPRLALQCTVVLLLGYWVPMRTVEYWCIRLSDVLVGVTVSVVIYPRRRDGVGKSPSVRRIEDIHDAELRRALIDLVTLRRQDGASDEDVLLGQPGVHEGRHQEQATMELVNESLWWGTGDAGASAYDLRHACFTRRALDVFADPGPLDAAGFLQVSAAGGHAGPDSTAWYVHRVEGPLAACSARWRPKAWQVPEGSDPDPARGFADLCDGYVVDVPPLPDRRPAPPTRTSRGLTLSERTEVLWDVQRNFQLAVVAAAAGVGQDVVEHVIGEMAEVLTMARMVKRGVVATLRGRCQALVAYKLWARAARQPKHDGIATYLDRMAADGDWETLGRLWQDWTLCKHLDGVSLENGRPAARLVSFLIEAGIPTTSLVIAAAPSDIAPPREIQHLGLQSRPVKARKGRPVYRLFVAPRGLSARDCNAATVSMRGLHWWLLVLGSALTARGAI